MKNKQAGLKTQMAKIYPDFLFSILNIEQATNYLFLLIKKMLFLFLVTL